MIDSRFQAALDYIYSFVDYETQRRPHDSAHYDLRRVEEILDRLGNPHRKAKSIHIAGSKGKGSVSAMIASVLTASGYRTGLYTSPHLLNFNERIRVDDRLSADAEIADLVDRIKPHVEAVNSQATYGRLTTFEIITALGFAYFEMKGCEFNVVEVGLGGRLDATNVILPEVCAITSISLEHTDVLGNTLAEIAAEKAGIIKPGTTVVSSPQAAEVDQVIERVCREKPATLIRAGADITWELTRYDSTHQSLRVRGRLGTYDLTIPLIGEYQLENAAVAVGCLESLMAKGYHLTPTAIATGLARVDWPGRLQVLGRHPYVVADGAHNPYSAAKLREALKKYFRFERATLIIGTSSDKDIAGIVAELAPLFARVIVTRSIHPRALPTAPLVAEFKRQHVQAEAADDISTALPMALSEAGPNDLICVTGSLFVVAGAIELTKAPALSPNPGGRT
jgi:dihydrofolate synthase/folylpolyglutamate synthase